MGVPCICTPTYLDGHHYSQWIGTYFGICAYTWRDIGGIAATFISIALWSILSLPQYYEIYELKSVEGVSILMLLWWSLADTLGLFGLILTNQHDTLFWFSVYYVFSDLLSVFQWVYYRFVRPNTARGRKYPPQSATSTTNPEGTTIDDLSSDNDNVRLEQIKTQQDGENVSQEEPSSVLVIPSEQVTDSSHNNSTTISSNRLSSSITRAASVTKLLSIIFFICLITFSTSSNAAMNTQTSRPAMLLHHTLQFVQDATGIQLTDEPAGKPCEAQLPLKHWQKIVGRVLTALASIGNTYSRIPQVILNYRRKFTEGLNVLFVVLQVFACLFFLVARFLPSTFTVTEEWWFNSFPWCVSSGAGAFLTSVMWWQIYWYGNGVIPPKREQKYANHILDVILFWRPIKWDNTEDDIASQHKEPLLSEEGGVSDSTALTIDENNAYKIQ